MSLATNGYHNPAGLPRVRWNEKERRLIIAATADAYFQHPGLSKLELLRLAITRALPDERCRLIKATTEVVWFEPMLADEIKAREFERRGKAAQIEVVPNELDPYVPILKGTKQATREIAALQREIRNSHQRLLDNQKQVATSLLSITQGTEATSATLCLILSELKASRLVMESVNAKLGMRSV